MLELKNARFGFKNKPIFENLNMGFEPNIITGVIGRNGVGKTTLFRAISNIYQLDEGYVLYKNKELRALDVAFLATDPYFYSYMNGGEYIDLVVTNKEKNKKNRYYASQLDIPLDVLTDVYSTGMKKKLAFSSAISQNRPIQIFDEPFNGVDLEGNEVIKHLLQEHKTDKITIVSSHILGTMLDICDKIYLITEGYQLKLYTKGEFDVLKKEMTLAWK